MNRAKYVLSNGMKVNKIFQMTEVFRVFISILVFIQKFVESLSVSSVGW